MELTLTIGRKLRHARQARNLRLEDLGAALGVDPSYISRVERDRLVPAREYIAHWAGLLRIDADQVYFGFGFVPPDLQTVIEGKPEAAGEIRQLLKG